jgi:hypothetical protein
MAERGVDFEKAYDCVKWGFV